jgi:hypothetical protein
MEGSKPSIFLLMMVMVRTGPVLCFSAARFAFMPTAVLPQYHPQP